MSMPNSQGVSIEPLSHIVRHAAKPEEAPERRSLKGNPVSKANLAQSASPFTPQSFVQPLNIPRGDLCRDNASVSISWTLVLRAVGREESNLACITKERQKTGLLMCQISKR